MSDAVEDPDELLPDALWARLLKAYDDPWEIYAPHDFDFIEATSRFLRLVHALLPLVGGDADVDVWPTLQGAAFHGELTLPPGAMSQPEPAAVRASNFGNLIAVRGAAGAVRPEVMTALRRAFDRHGYRYVPPAPLRAPYAGHHAGKVAARDWLDRFFGHP